MDKIRENRATFPHIFNKYLSRIRGALVDFSTGSTLSTITITINLLILKE